MNNKGFTLIELLGVVIILAILVSITTPLVLKSLNSGKEASYNMMIENIVTASKSYYEECKYGDIKNSDGTKKVCGNTVNLTLGELVNLGFLTGTNEKSCDSSGNNCTTKLIIKNPKTDEDISNCNITINVSTNTNGKVTYEVVSSTTNNPNCPNNTLGSTN